MDPTPAPRSAFEYRSEGEQVTDPVYIAALLKKVKDSRTLVQVTLPGTGREYNSALLDINPEQGYLLMDELTPPEGHRLILQNGGLNAAIRLRGVDIRFTSTVQEIGGQSGIAFYRVEFPRQMYYRQRREYYRVKIGMGLLVPVSIQREATEPLEGRLDDLSVGGIGALLKQDVHLRKGEVLPSCRIQLPSGDRIDCEIEVRFTSEDEQHRKYHLGARFLHLSRHLQNALARFVAEVEREMLRHMPKE